MKSAEVPNISMAGACVGGFIGRSLGFYGPGQAADFFFSGLCAVLLLFGYNALRGNRATTWPPHQLFL
jgi:uncharacterized membrane protein YeaQ/YmgE (transglycosylase-associated protein family)